MNHNTSKLYVKFHRITHTDENTSIVCVTQYVHFTWPYLGFQE